MLAKNGVPTSEELREKLPTQQRLQMGPVAIIECFQPIPCDPCYHSCVRGAINKFDDINDIPELDDNKCTGCGICVSSCPGLAIFVVDATYQQGYGLIKLPYELLPLPEKGEEVEALDRKGEKVCKAEVVEVRASQRQDKTAVIGLKVPLEYLMEVRNIRVRGARR